MSEATMSYMAKLMNEREKDNLGIKMSDMLSDLTKVEGRYLPLRVFEEYFLAFFKNKGDVEDGATLRAKWVELAGDMYTPVNIIDGNDEVLFTIPGICNGTTPTGDLKDYNFFEIFSSYKSRTTRHPGDGERYLTNVLSGVKEVLDTGNNPHKDTLDKVLSRYESGGVASEGLVDNDGGWDINYD